MADSAPRTRQTEPDKAERQAGRNPPGLLMGRPFGIPVYVSPSWFVVAAIITFWFGGQIPDHIAVPPVSYLVAFVYAVLLYGSVFVHELSHALVARSFRLPVRSVTLHILGGETAIEQEPATPGREFLIAFAGPLVNLVLAGAGLLTGVLLPLPPVGDLLLQALTFANLAVGVFNLLPGTPLDGGRLVRALIWKVTGRPRTGTVIVAWFGRGVAVLLLIAGTFAAVFPAEPRGGGGIGADGWLMVLWAALISSFMWVGATQTLRDVRIRDRIPHLRARLLARPATLVTANVPLAEAVRRANQDGSGALVIVDYEGRPTGLVNERAVLATPHNRRPWIEVGDLSRGLDGDLTLSADLAGEELISAVRKAPASEYLLVEPTGQVYGVLAADDVNRVFSGI
ncbi:site-2 protease family protein [Actinomadura scrupuli]|uniref:site-2 protease family protein n=1 Tax=Actinomadura scrupuli TaxID=559629 RepID=UPI003D95D5B7